MGLVVHGMAGFDRGKARAMLGVPDDYEIEANEPLLSRAIPPSSRPGCKRSRNRRDEMQSRNSHGKASLHSEARSNGSRACSSRHGYEARVLLGSCSTGRLLRTISRAGFPAA